MKLPLAALLLTLFALPAWAQTEPTFRFEFSNPQLNPSHWVITVQPDGFGHFHAESAPPPVEVQKLLTSSKRTAPVNLDREIRLSPEFAATVFSAARSHQLFQMDCESHLKVAFEGDKTLSYNGPEGSGSCTYNYSRDKQIQDLGSSLLAVANTILSGARMESLLQHDRLGLDREMEFLVQAAANGQAQQIIAIREILSRLAADETVLDRVKRRARTLLAKIEN